MADWVLIGRGRVSFDQFPHFFNVSASFVAEPKTIDYLCCSLFISKTEPFKDGFGTWTNYSGSLVRWSVKNVIFFEIPILTIEDHVFDQIRWICKLATLHHLILKAGSRISGNFVLFWPIAVCASKPENKMASGVILNISVADQIVHNYPLEDRQVGRRWIKRRRRRRIVQLACIGSVIEIWAESNKSRRSYDGRAKSGLPTDEDVSTTTGGEGTQIAHKLKILWSHSKRPYNLFQIRKYIIMDPHTHLCIYSWKTGRPIFQHICGFI